MKLSIALLYPELLGTYGDGGNALVLKKRSQWRGIDAEIITVQATDALPTADIYVIGGGEDGPQSHAADLLIKDGNLKRAVEKDAVLLAVCAGFQIMGNSFEAPDGKIISGLGILDMASNRGKGKRAVGEVLVNSQDLLGVGLLSGFENHGGRTTLGRDLSPLGKVEVGVGNGSDDVSQRDYEGAFQKQIIGTYLHGPVLARNPKLCDRLLEWATGSPVNSIDDIEIESLRTQRIVSARHKVQKRSKAPR